MIRHRLLVLVALFVAACGGRDDDASPDVAQTGAGDAPTDTAPEPDARPSAEGDPDEDGFGPCGGKAVRRGAWLRTTGTFGDAPEDATVEASSWIVRGVHDGSDALLCKRRFQ